MGDAKYFVRLRIGHKSEMLDHPTPNGLTHRWTVFVHSLSKTPFTDRSFISKVVFELHPDFPNPRRVVKEPPFEVTEMGYAGFSIPIHITFTGVNKVYRLTYDMNLVLDKFSEHFCTQTIEMKQPSAQFRELIMKYGGLKKDPAEKCKEKEKEKEKQHRSRKGTTSSSSEEPLPKKKEKTKEKKSRSGSNPPLGKLKILRSLVEGEKRQKKSASVDNLANLVPKPLVTPPDVVTKVSPQSETKTAVVMELKQVESVSSDPSTSTESNYCSDSEGSKITTLSTETCCSSLTATAENENTIEKQYGTEFLVRLQKKLMTLDDPDKMYAVAEALLTPTSASPSLPPDLLLTDNNLLCFDVCKLSPSLICRLNEICFGTT